MAEAPLWAKALKGVADFGTVVGNGLAFGRGEDIKQTLGWAGQNSAKALGLMEGDYVPLKSYLQQGAAELAQAREGAGTPGAIVEPLAGLVGGGAALGGGYKLATGGYKLAKTLAPSLPTALKIGGAALTGLAGYSMTGSGTTPEDFVPKSPAGSPAGSSATDGPQPASKQAGAAAVAAESDWSPRKKAFVDFMTSGSLPRMEQALKMGTIGQTAPLKPRDAAFGQLSNLLKEQYAEEYKVDPAKARANYIRGLGALIQPSGVMYMPDGEQ